MAFTRLALDGYGVLELNNVAFRRDGRIEAQCALSTVDFGDTAPAENGMILAVDDAKKLICKPTGDLPLALNYTSEHIYNDRAPGLKEFASRPGEFYPRLGYLAVGDKFTTNCVAYDSAEFADQSAIESAMNAAADTAVYGFVTTDGVIAITNATAAPTGCVDAITLRAVKGTTMPDGQYGIKFQVYKA